MNLVIDDAEDGIAVLDVGTLFDQAKLFLEFQWQEIMVKKKTRRAIGLLLRQVLELAEGMEYLKL